MKFPLKQFAPPVWVTGRRRFCVLEKDQERTAETLRAAGENGG